MDQRLDASNLHRGDTILRQAVDELRWSMKNARMGTVTVNAAQLDLVLRTIDNLYGWTKGDKGDGSD